MYLEEDLQKKGESVITGKDVPKTKEKAEKLGYEIEENEQWL
jgi:hypothetical protein